MNNKTVVIYKSKTGFTERYAEWICEELNCEKVPYKDRKKVRFEDYDTIIYGGGFQAGFINGLKWFKEKMAAVEGKKWVVFGTGATPAEAPEVQNALKQNFTEEEWTKVKVFYMQSGLCYEKMGVMEKFMMAAFRKMLKTTEGESEAYKMVQSSYDYASRDFIAPLVEYCKEEKKSTALVIMAAGMGSRFGGGIKQLEPVGPNGEIIMDYSIYDAIEAGFDKVVFVTRKDLLETFKEVIGNRIAEKIPVEYALQELDNLPEGFAVPEGRTKPWGTGQAILCCKDIVKEPFLVINADDYYGKEAFKLIHDYLVEEHTGDKQYNFCMAGFILGNTLSDNGGVTRGICLVDEKGNLVGVKETGGIVKTENGAACDDGEGNQVPCDINSHVSMNMWGFTPDFFTELETGFTEFLSNLQEGDVKSEYLLPMIVDGLIQQQKADVTVLETKDKWFGVTYKEDKPVVVESIRKLIAEGLYPAK